MKSPVGREQTIGASRTALHYERGASRGCLSGPCHGRSVAGLVRRLAARGSTGRRPAAAGLALRPWRLHGPGDANRPMRDGPRPRRWPAHSPTSPARVLNTSQPDGLGHRSLEWDGVQRLHEAQPCATAAPWRTRSQQKAKGRPEALTDRGGRGRLEPAGPSGGGRGVKPTFIATLSPQTQTHTRQPNRNHGIALRDSSPRATELQILRVVRRARDCVGGRRCPPRRRGRR